MNLRVCTATGLQMIWGTQQPARPSPKVSGFIRHMPTRPQNVKVVCVVDRRNNRMLRALENAGYQVLTTYSGDHAVAICVNQHIQAVVLEQSLFIEVEGWSIAQSIKMVRPKTCVLLVTDGAQVTSVRPDGVDAVVHEADLNTLPAVLHTLIS